MATETYMPENFLDLYAFCRKEESNENEETMIYIFLGFNFQAECVFDDEQKAKQAQQALQAGYDQVYLARPVRGGARVLPRPAKKEHTPRREK